MSDCTFVKLYFLVWFYEVKKDVKLFICKVIDVWYLCLWTILAVKVSVLCVLCMHLVSPSPKALVFASLDLVIQRCHWSCLTSCSVPLDMPVKYWNEMVVFHWLSLGEYRWQLIFTAVKHRLKCSIMSWRYVLISSSRAITATVNITAKIGGITSDNVKKLQIDNRQLS